MRPEPKPLVELLRMKDLCEQTGLTRQAIHFYIQQGLVPEGTKTGKNMAWYGPEHVERLRLIRRLQEEQYLPLKAIRALLAGETAHLDPAKRALLAEVGARLDRSVKGPPPEMVDAAAVCERNGVPIAEVERAAAAGVVAARVIDGRLQIPTDAVWLVDAWGQLRNLGFTEDLGFGVEDLQVYQESIQTLFQQQAARIVERIAHLPPAQVAIMIERALPLLNAILIHLHTAAMRHFFAAIER